MVTTAFEPAVDYGGPVAKVGALGRALIDLGHEVEVWCADYGSGRSRLGAGRAVRDGLPVRYFRRWASYRWTPVVPQVVAAGDERFDVVHCFGVRDLIGLPLVASRVARGRAVVVEPLGMLSRGFRNAGAKAVFDRFIARPLLERVGAVIASSELEERLLRETLDADVRVRYNPLVALPAVSPRPPSARNGAPLNALWLGRISRTKGLAVLVEAIGRLDDVRLSIVGPDDGDGEADDLVRSMARPDIAGKVERRGSVDAHERDSLIQQADVVVLASRAESFGNVAAEAMALGRPVIVSDRCGIAPLVSELEAGLVVSVDATEIAGALAALRDDDDLRTRLGANGVAIRARLAPSRIAAEQVAIYEAVLL